MGVSRRSYAAQRGVSEAAVREAITTGRITKRPDGTIDPARADAEWAHRLIRQSTGVFMPARWARKPQQERRGPLLQSQCLIPTANEADSAWDSQGA